MNEKEKIDREQAKADFEEYKLYLKEVEGYSPLIKIKSFKEKYGYEITYTENGEWHFKGERYNSNFDLGQIYSIYPNFEIKNNILHLIGEVKGENLEKITKFWNGKIYVDILIGIYNHSADVYLKVGRNNGKISGNLTNANICYKSNKKLKQEKRKLFKNSFKWF